MTQYLSQLSLARLLAASLLLGIGLGLVYDLFRIRRLAFSSRLLPKKQAPRALTLLDRFLLHGEDLLFGLIAGVATAILYFALSRGRLRLMAIVGEGIGFLLYRASLGRLVMLCADSILRVIARICRSIARYLIRPPIRLLRRLTAAVCRRIRHRWGQMKEKRLLRIGGREATAYTEALGQMAASGFAENALDNRRKLRKTEH